MKRLRLPLLGSKTLIQAARLPPFTSVLRCHTRSSKGKVQNLISSNSVAVMQIPAYQLVNPNIHRFLKPVKLPTPALPKRLSLILLLAKFSQRAPIPIVNPLLKNVRIFEGIQGAHSYSASLKNSNKIDKFSNRPPVLVLTF